MGSISRCNTVHPDAVFSQYLSGNRTIGYTSAAKNFQLMGRGLFRPQTRWPGAMPWTPTIFPNVCYFPSQNLGCLGLWVKAYRPTVGIFVTCCSSTGIRISRNDAGKSQTSKVQFKLVVIVLQHIEQLRFTFMHAVTDLHIINAVTPVGVRPILYIVCAFDV